MEVRNTSGAKGTRVLASLVVVGHAQGESMSGLPEIDITILSWNRSKDTIAAVQSALRQRGVEQRVWIVDQGSEASELSQLESFLQDQPRVVLVRLPTNAGVPGGRNIATRLGSAPIVVGIDNDAEFGSDDELLKIQGFFEKSPQLGALGFRILNYHTGAVDLTSWNYPHDVEQFNAVPFQATKFVGAGHAFRRSAYEAAGGYDDRLWFMEEEKDLSYRIINAGFWIHYCPDIQILHKISPEMRVHWNKGRQEYMCRNIIYLEFKFGSSFRRILSVTKVFAYQSWKNGMFRSGLTGLLRGYALGFASMIGNRHVLSKNCRALIRKYDESVVRP